MECLGGGGGEGGHLMEVWFVQVDVPVLDNTQCEAALQKTRLGPDFLLHPVEQHHD